MESFIDKELQQILDEDNLGELINVANVDDALALIKKVNPLKPTSSLWDGDPSYPSFLGFAIQKNLPILVNEMFKQINLEENQHLIDREFFGLCIFNDDDVMWEVFLKNVDKLHITIKFSVFECALDVLLSKGYRERVTQVLPKLDEDEILVVNKRINK